MKQNLLFLTLLSGLCAFNGLSAPRALAMPPEYQVNVREGCRQAIGGAYLKAYDDKERSTGYQTTLKEQMQTLKEALTIAQKKAKEAEQAVAGHDFDATLAQARDDTASVVRTLTAQMGDYKEMLAKNAGHIATAAAEEKRQRQQIDTVFQFLRQNDIRDGGYPTGLTYRSPCPKYRALCPLPAKERDALALFKLDSELPEACRKYIGQSNIKS